MLLAPRRQPAVASPRRRASAAGVAGAPSTARPPRALPRRAARCCCRAAAAPGNGSSPPHGGGGGSNGNGGAPRPPGEGPGEPDGGGGWRRLPRLGREQLVSAALGFIAAVAAVAGVSVVQATQAVAEQQAALGQALADASGEVAGLSVRESVSALKRLLREVFAELLGIKARLGGLEAAAAVQHEAADDYALTAQLAGPGGRAGEAWERAPVRVSGWFGAAGVLPWSQEARSGDALAMLAGLGAGGVADGRLQLHSVLAGGKRRVTATLAPRPTRAGRRCCSCSRCAAGAGPPRRAPACWRRRAHLPAPPAPPQLLYRVQIKDWLQLMVAPLGGTLDALGRGLTPISADYGCTAALRRGHGLSLLDWAGSGKAACVSKGRLSASAGFFVGGAAKAKIASVQLKGHEGHALSLVVARCQRRAAAGGAAAAAGGGADGDGHAPPLRFLGVQAPGCRARSSAAVDGTGGQAAATVVGAVGRGARPRARRPAGPALAPCGGGAAPPAAPDLFCELAAKVPVGAGLHVAPGAVLALRRGRASLGYLGPGLAAAGAAAAVAMAEGRPSEPAEAPCEPSCSTSDVASSECSGRAGPGFILHRVTKLDTLAGLAIRYNVTVSDIKRANGILSDNAMFARECIKIPTGQMPIGEEAQVLFARLMSGYGRDASLNAKERKAPGTASITQLPGSPTSASRSSCFGSEAVDADDPGTPYSRRSDKSSSEPGDVELIERSMADGSYGYGSDRVRRRTKGDSLSSSRHGSVTAAAQLSQVAEAAVGWLSNAAAAASGALPPNGLAAACMPSAAADRRGMHSAGTHSDQGGGGGNAWHQLSSGLMLGSSSLVAKIKRAASQPALAGPPGAGGGGFGDAADALLRGGAPRLPSLTSGSGGSGVDLLARGTGLVALPPRKDTKGD
ncbi:hypothetical protein HT031_005349 [Scenedesmus sp. PABB004]|nr:hypothetical protein HT031_005349 [Scenedesmus sp. PABB004]